MKLMFTYAELNKVRDMLRRPEWCCALHTWLRTILDECGNVFLHPRHVRSLIGEAVWLTPQEINEFRDMLQRPEWCCALHTKMLDFLNRADVKAHLRMEAECLAAYDAGDRTTLAEVIEVLANDTGR